LGYTNVAADASGNARFVLTLPSQVPKGQFIAATATDPDGNTSEFSQCTLVTAAHVPTPFSIVGTMTTARWDNTATLLADGRVLVTGGSDASNCCVSEPIGLLASSELYDPTPRCAHGAVDIPEIVPEIHDKLTDLETPPSLEPEQVPPK